MGRALAIDYGKRRCGVAVTDPLRIIASPLTTLATGELIPFLIDYIPQQNVTDVVIGYPVTMNNQPSESVRYIDPFIARFRKLFPEVPLHLADERFTSQIALRAMIEGGAGRQKRRDKALTDRISASLILQSWLKEGETRDNSR